MLWNPRLLHKHVLSCPTKTFSSCQPPHLASPSKAPKGILGGGDAPMSPPLPETRLASAARDDQDEEGTRPPTPMTARRSHRPTDAYSLVLSCLVSFIGTSVFSCL